MVFPLNRVRIQHQFVFCFEIVKHGHLSVTDHNQLLLFIGMQPRDKNMGLNATRKRQKTQSNVRDLIVQIIASLRLDRVGHLAHQPENHRDIMGSKRPENVLFAPNFSEIKAVRINVLNPAKLSFFNQFLKLQYGRMVPKKMTNHEHTAPLKRQRH